MKRAVEKRKAKSAKPHPCIAKMNDALRPTNQRLRWAMSLNGAPQRIYVAVEHIEPSRQSPMMLAANFCPFCGEKLP